MSARDHDPSTDAATRGPLPRAAPEPDYIRQSSEPMTDEESRHWFHRVSDEAISEGVTWARFSVHPEIKNLRLVEGWLEHPQVEGEQRWSLVGSEPQPRAPQVERDQAREANPPSPNHQTGEQS